MNKLKQMLMVAVLAATVFSACRKEKEDPIVPEPEDDVVALTGNLTTRTLTADKKYLLQGQVFINNGQVVTIEPGTVIMGEKRTKGVLIVNRGGRLIARGQVDKPIVMTSNQAPGDRDRGDWGGLVILGSAATNQVDPAIEGIDPAVFFGGNPANTSSASTAVNNDNSGEYKYLRVEFAGIELSPNNETNSITMGGVGNGTLMEHCMVSYGGDDGFEWFGGTVNGKWFIAHASWDDCFDVDFGWSGNVQFGLAVRYTSYADQSGSNSFECDNGPNDNDVQPYTTGTFSNITCIGPIKNGTSISNGNFQHSMDLRRRTAVSILNSVFTGFPRGIRMNQASVYSQYAVDRRAVLANNLLISPSTSATYQAGSGVNVDSVKSYWLAGNQTIEGATTDAQYTAAGINPDWIYGTRLDTQYPANPNFTVTSGTTATGASFTHPKFNEAGRTGFFTTVAYRGGFGATDWTDTWAEFRPVDKAY